MPHIHTEPGQHDLTTTAFIIREIDGEPHVLIHKHKKLSILLPVGGHVELHETPWAASMHEIREEAGYDPSQLMVLQPLERIIRMDGVKTHPVPLFLQTHQFKKDVNHYHIDIGYAFVANGLPQHSLGVDESADIRWMNQQAITDAADDMPEDVSQITEFIFTVAYPKWERVSPESFDQ